LVLNIPTRAVLPILRKDWSLEKCAAVRTTLGSTVVREGKKEYVLNSGKVILMAKFLLQI
jgi:hypothetical protein